MDGPIENFLALTTEKRSKSAWWKLAQFYLSKLKAQTGYTAKIGRFQIFEDPDSEVFVGQIHVPMPLKDAGGEYCEGIFSISLNSKYAPAQPASLDCEITAFPYSAEGKHIGLEEDIDYFQLTFQTSNWVEDGRISPEYPGEWDNYIEGAFWENLEASPQKPVFKNKQDVNILLNLISNDYLAENVQQWQMLLVELSCNNELLITNNEGQIIQAYPANAFKSLLKGPGKHGLLKLDSIEVSNNWQPGTYNCKLRIDYLSKDGSSRTYTSEISETFSFEIIN